MNSHSRDSDMFFVPSSGIESIATAKNVPIPAFTQHTQKLTNYHAINRLTINSAASRPKFIILWGHVEEVLLLNKFFSDCRYMP